MKKKLVAYLSGIYDPIQKSKEIGIYKPDTAQEDYDIRAKNFQNINALAKILLNGGYVVVSPITMYHSIDKYNKTWRNEMALNLIQRCDVVIILWGDGVEDSIEVKNEFMIAYQENKPVLYMDKEGRVRDVRGN